MILNIVTIIRLPTLNPGRKSFELIVDELFVSTVCCAVSAEYYFVV